MFYFNYFPQVIKNNILLTDITKRYDIFEKILQEEKYFFFIELSQGETIENIAERLYGSPEYSWLILLSTRAEHPAFVNYKTDREMTDFIKQKYGPALFETHHYQRLDGRVLDDVDTLYYKANPHSLTFKDVIKVSFDSFEREENEKRRILKVIRPEFLPQIESEIKNLFS